LSEPVFPGWRQDAAGKWHREDERRPTPPAQPAQPAKDRRLRPFTWFILAVNVLFLVWVVSAPSGASKGCAGLTGDQLQACRAGTTVGTAIGVAVIIFLWVATDVILGVVWLVTNRRG